MIAWQYDGLGRLVGMTIVAPILWYAGETGDTTLLKPIAVTLFVWESLWVAGVLTK